MKQRKGCNGSQVAGLVAKWIAKNKDAELTTMNYAMVVAAIQLKWEPSVHG